MADLVNRAEWEAALAHALERLGKRRMNLLIEALGDPPDLNRVPPEFWNEFSTELRGELVTTLEQVFLDSAEDMLGTTTIGVDWALVNREAARWARESSYELVRNLAENTRAALREKIPAFFEQGLTMGQLKESLSGLFGSVRAELIAATEVTRAAVQGELATVREIEKAGIQMVAVWNTNNDDIVCPICGPRNQKKQGDGWYDVPPAHPRCRCWLSHEFAET